MSTRNIKDAKDLSTGELIYFKGHAKATYMSDGRTVEEAVSGMSGGSSSGSGAYAEVNHGTSDTNFTLTPNTFHVWDEVANLALTFGSETAGVANEYLFQFTSGATATTLSLPSDLKWANDSAPTIEPNMIYQVSILKGLASVLEFAKTLNLITFTIRGIEYQAEEGMTWEEWCDSEYNYSSYYVYNDRIRKDEISIGGSIYINNVTPTDIIVTNQYTTYSATGGADD